MVASFGGASIALSSAAREAIASTCAMMACCRAFACATLTRRRSTSLSVPAFTCAPVTVACSPSSFSELSAICSMAIAWNHIQLDLVDRLGDEGLALARQLAMTTYRSEIDFDGRFGRAREPDGRFSINSYLDHQGDKLVDRFDRDTYRTLAREVARLTGRRDRALERLLDDVRHAAEIEPHPEA